MTTKPTLNGLAPYPKTLEDATAEAMARDHAVRTQAHFVRSMDLPFGHPDERHAINAMSWSFGITYLLRALIEHAPDKADEIASGLWSEWHGGDGFGEWSFEWLTEYGIDPNAVNEIVAALPETTPADGVIVSKADLRRYLDADQSDMDASVEGLRRLWAAAGIGVEIDAVGRGVGVLDTKGDAP